MKSSDWTVERAPDLNPASALLFVINAASGHHDLEQTRQMIESTLTATGRTGELLITEPKELARTADQAAARAGTLRSAVVAVGGDGTINTVAQAAHTAGCAMGVVPQGTFNYFARNHGLPDDPEGALHALLSSAPVAVQVGLVNDRVFLVNASLGLYPDLLQDREAYKARFGRSRLVAFGAGLVTLLGQHRQLRLRIDVGASGREVKTTTLFVGNNRLQLERLGLDEAQGLDHGCLAAVMLQPVGALAMLGLLWRGAMGTLGEATTLDSFGFHRMVVRPQRAWRHRMVKVAFDGEVARMRAPLEFRVASKPLYLLKPQPDPEQTEPAEARDRDAG